MTTKKIIINIKNTTFGKVISWDEDTDVDNLDEKDYKRVIEFLEVVLERVKSKPSL